LAYVERCLAPPLKGNEIVMIDNLPAGPLPQLRFRPAHTATIRSSSGLSLGATSVVVQTNDCRLRRSAAVRQIAPDLWTAP
jgi:hypothetical protein